MQLAKSAAIVVIAAAASGGIALAAASPSGAPAQPGRELPSNAASQAQEHAAVPLSSHPTPKATKTAGTGNGHGKSADSRSHGSPHPNLNGLCHAWLAGAGSQHGKARSNPAFTALITAAGGAGNVAGYCATVIATHPSDSESDDAQESGEAGQPDHPDRTDHPGNGRVTAHPTGRPTK
ncbi:MAG: hypothetical protein ABR571_16535 [Jatrophihabitans sp.]|uniref:hypothetical protein n=1 Tax=Jatrophihabitans sp. TaxID=1932789 RepID=UPI00390EBCA2